MKRKIPMPQRLPRRPLRKGLRAIHLSARREQEMLNPDPLELLARNLGLKETEIKNIYEDRRGYKFLKTSHGFINNK